MEFFAIANIAAAEPSLRKRLTITDLPRFCASIDTVLAVSGDRGRIYCLWGEFAVHRQEIRGGVRFSLPGCPNGVQWTITTGYPPAPAHTVIHCTINRSGHDEDFVASLESFVADWRVGLEQAWAQGD